MVMTIELTPDVEAGLKVLAKASGLALPDYVQNVLREQVATQPVAASAADRAAAWRSSFDGLPLGLPLSDAAISREALYDAHG